jgi:predicted secreted protein
MGVFTGVVVYAVVWFLVLFMVLPWGVRIPDEPEPGHAPSAPTNPRIKLKMAVTTVIAGVAWLIIYFVVESGVISFREQALEMPGLGP